MTTSRKTSRENVQNGHNMSANNSGAEKYQTYFSSFTQIRQTISWWYKSQVRSPMSLWTYSVNSITRCSPVTAPLFNTHMQDKAFIVLENSGASENQS